MLLNERQKKFDEYFDENFGTEKKNQIGLYLRHTIRERENRGLVSNVKYNTKCPCECYLRSREKILFFLEILFPEIKVDFLWLQRKKSIKRKINSLK